MMVGAHLPYDVLYFPLLDTCCRIVTSSVLVAVISRVGASDARSA